MVFLPKKSIKKTPWFFCPLVQLDQNAILDKLFWTKPFCPTLFGFYLLGIFTHKIKQKYLGKNKKIYNLKCF
jgi:hypothetical protein